MENAHLLKETSSPRFGPDDPVKKKPRFQSKPDRKHPLFVKHELVAAIIDTHKVSQFNSVLHVTRMNMLYSFFFFIGQRTEDHRRHEAAGEGKLERNGGNLVTQR